MILLVYFHYTKMIILVYFHYTQIILVYFHYTKTILLVYFNYTQRILLVYFNYTQRILLVYFYCIITFKRKVVHGVRTAAQRCVQEQHVHHSAHILWFHWLILL